MTTVAILGAGPHGRSIEHVLADDHIDIVLCDDNRARWPELPDTLSGARRFPWVIGAAWPAVRQAVAARLSEAPEVVMGAYYGGTVVFQGARLDTSARIGRHVHVGYNAVVSHGCEVQDFAHVAAGAVLGGDVLVGRGAFIGAGAVVSHGGITIGPGAMIGAGAVLTDDTIAAGVYAGSPARLIATDWDHTEMALGGRARGHRHRGAASVLSVLQRSEPAS